MGPTLWAFLVVEFAGHALSAWAAHLAIILYSAAYIALAVTIARSPESAWAVAPEELSSADPVGVCR